MIFTDLIFNKRYRADANSVLFHFGYAYEALTNSYLHKHMEPFILSYLSDEAFKHTFQHDSEEMLFVLQRKMRFK
jgi:hypothetical protein